MYKRPMFVWFGLCCIFEMCILNRTDFLKVLLFAVIISFTGHLPEFLACVHSSSKRVTALTDVIICFSILCILGFKTISLNLKDHEFSYDSFTGKIIDINNGDGYCNYTVKTGNYKILVSISKRPDPGTGLDDPHIQILDINDTAGFKGTAKPFEEPEVFGQFDEYSYYVDLKGYDSRFYAESAELVNKGSPGIRSWFLKLFKKRLSCFFDDEDAGVVTAMTLGDKSFMRDELKDIYKDNGLLHLTVVSGTHITLLGMAFFNFLKRLKGVRFAAGGSMVIVVFYVYITGFNPSSNRAVIMMLMLFGAMLVKRTYDMPSALGLAGVIVLLGNPLNIKGSGFRLSFLAVFAICFLYKPIMASLYIKQNSDETVISGKEKIKNRFLMLFWSPLLLSLSINLITLPVILDNYYEYPIYSTFANCLIIPVIPLILILSMLVMIFGVIRIPAYMAAGAASGLLKFQYILLKHMAALPFGKCLTGRPQMSSVIVYYSFIAVLIIIFPRFLRYLNPIRRKKLITVIMLWLMLIIGIFVLKRRNEDGFTMLKVGQGLCVVMKSGDEHFMFDAGSTSINSVGRKRILPYLKAKGISQIDYLFISHFDSDHINAVSDIVDDEEISVIKIICPPGTEKKHLEKAGIENEKEIYSICEFETIKGRDYSIICLNPSKGDGYSEENSGYDLHFDPEENDSSVCLYIKLKSITALITGDVSGKGEENLKKNMDILGIHSLDLIMVAHHGSGYSTSEEFLYDLKIGEAWISCGKNNRYGHPHKEVLERLTNIGCNILRTDMDGCMSYGVGGD